jgi:hypothetical protein
MNNPADNEQKKIWQEEATQLKHDLDNRPKEIKYQPKEIKFGGVAKAQKSVTSPQKATSSEDQFLRKQLGL